MGWISLLAMFGMMAVTEISAQPQINKVTITSRHQHMESVVVSANACFEIVVTSTAPEQIPIIKAIISNKHKDAGERTFLRYVSDSSVSRTTVNWFRKGIKERFEYEKDADPDVIAFDGGAIRELRTGKDGVVGAISSMEQAHWDSAPKVDPFSLLLEDYGRPWSGLIQRSSSEVREIEGGYVMEIADPDNAVRTVKFQMDSDGVLIQRDIYTQLAADLQPRLYERHLFANWTDFPVPGGESV